MMPHYMNYQSGMPVWYGPLITEIVWCCKISCIRTMIALQRNLAIGLIISKKCGRRAELPNAAMRWNIVQTVQDKFLRKELSTPRKLYNSDSMLVKPKCVWQVLAYANIRRCEFVGKHILASTNWATTRYVEYEYWIVSEVQPFIFTELILNTLYVYFKRTEKPFYSLPTCPKGREVS